MAADLVAFLNARFGEDEATATCALMWKQDHHHAIFVAHYGSEWGAIDDYDPARVLREVEAKRNILARYEDCVARQEDQDYPYASAAEQAREYEDFVLPNLAASYSDHPACRPEWKP